MARKIETLTIAHTPEQLLAVNRHADWEIRQANGTNRNGRGYIGHRVHGVSKTRKGLNRNACRGQVAY